ncbi:hypothetical protein K3495_g3963 [Podosphaera aphanis]|nr:hypothetical protein K3495_g3963 [Podosphaera aphanis]
MEMRELCNLNQRRILQNVTVDDKLFESIEIENDEIFSEWLECEKNQLEWQTDPTKKPRKLSTQCVLPS